MAKAATIKETKTVKSIDLRPGMIMSSGHEIDEVRRITENLVLVFWRKKEGRELLSGRFVLPERGGELSIVIL